MSNKKYHYIYLITNKLNGKIYIGQRASRKDPLKDNYWGGGKWIKASIKKHGKKNFEKEIILELHSKEELSSAEIELIKYCDSRNPKIGYNLSIGGESSKSGVRVSEETKEKHRASMIGRKIVKNGLPIYISKFKNLFRVSVRNNIVGDYNNIDLATIARDRFIKDGYKIGITDRIDYGISYRKDRNYFDVYVYVGNERIFISKAETIEEARKLKYYALYNKDPPINNEPYHYDWSSV